GLRDPAHLGFEPLRDVRPHDHGADDLAVAAAPGPDRGHRLDEVAGGELADRGDLLAAEPAPERRRPELARGEVTDDRIPDVQELPALRVEDGQRADRQELLLLGEEGGERLAAVLAEQALAIDGAGDVLAGP